MYPLLDTINAPSQLRELERKELPKIAEELRNFLVESVSQTGGHLSSNLGTIELTIALHYVFNTPEDRLVWDVGHQTYAHKILTGRRNGMSKLRMQGGVAGFPRRDESEYDTFGVGHSSTSISAALGMALASQNNNTEEQKSQQSVAVIGDGAMTAGMAFEALNHAASLDVNLTVILNDNDMSISENVGGFRNYLAKILSGKFYTSFKESGKKVVENMPKISRWAHRVEEHLKGMVMPGTLFEELGFNYIGPIDGHDLPALVATLENMKELSGPQFLHVVTKKGKGFAPAEKDPIGYHAINKIDPKPKATIATEEKPQKPKFSNVFGQWLCDVAEIDPRIVGITPAMKEGSDLIAFSERFPERYFDVAIAEQHAVTLAAGMACDGAKPVVAIYSTFLQRAYDQLIHDVSVQNLDVLFAIDRAGLVGEDGPTHAGSFDISYLRCIPEMLIMAPSDENELRQMLNTGYHHQGPAAVRYPRGTGIGAAIEDSLELLPIGKGRVVREGCNIAIMAFGTLLHDALLAAEELNATLIDMRFVKPLDIELITLTSNAHSLLVTIEENSIAGGAGSGINEFLNQAAIETPIINLGLPDYYVEHGKPAELLKECGLDKQGILKSIKTKWDQLQLKGSIVAINSDSQKVINQ